MKTTLISAEDWHKQIAVPPDAPLYIQANCDQHNYDIVRSIQINALMAAAEIELNMTYKGGGIWRADGIPEGVKAETAHGGAIIEIYRQAILSLVKQLEEKK